MAKSKQPENQPESPADAAAADLVVPDLDSYTLQDLEQVKVLADPLRLKILGGFRHERTTKQVADLLGEKPTRLYHHVEALERVGVIRQTRTQQNRGTLEKYYLAVAKTFRAGEQLFSGPETPQGAESLQSVVSTIMGSTTDELHQLIADGGGELIQERGLLTYVELIATEKDIAELQEKLQALLTELVESCDDEPPPDDRQRYRLTIAYFPLEESR